MLLTMEFNGDSIRSYLFKLGLTIHIHIQHSEREECRIFQQIGHDSFVVGEQVMDEVGHVPLHGGISASLRITTIHVW